MYSSGQLFSLLCCQLKHTDTTVRISSFARILTLGMVIIEESGFSFCKPLDFSKVLDTSKSLTAP
jgi:hypothetical protein